MFLWFWNHLSKSHCDLFQFNTMWEHMGGERMDLEAFEELCDVVGAGMYHFTCCS